MAAPSATSIPRVHGKLILTPTDNSSSPLYGGTDLGAVRRVRFEPGYNQVPIASEYYGQTQEVLHIQGNCVLGCLLRGWDGDALSTIFPGYALASSEHTLTFPGGVLSGRKLSGTAVKVLYAARRSEHPSVVLYNAIPLVEPSAELRKSILNELEIPVFFLGLRDGSGNIGAMGPIAGLTI